jgi:hypothetical protein
VAQDLELRSESVHRYSCMYWTYHSVRVQEKGRHLVWVSALAIVDSLLSHGGVAVTCVGILR